MGACDRKSASLREGQRGRQNERKENEDKCLSACAKMHAHLNAHSLKIHACTKVNKSFELPFVRPKGPTVIQQLRERDPKTTSSTPLIVSHSSGLSLAYLEASVYAELLPPSG
ncbi:MAG: hypothetical protein ACPIOQ_55685 [Promethearchaeia archaeon]